MDQHFTYTRRLHHVIKRTGHLAEIIILIEIGIDLILLIIDSSPEYLVF